ncbi:hypothetical protein T02_14685 [Trichinella nativa]|uniref:Uncharacterized protein n=1 Tax=Trichinella nativa TaxID=6335 RepID=A0A0V1KQ23_9BILA|nr:hypothetical protein T02_14685 [Trichinella nativa]
MTFFKAEVRQEPVSLLSAVKFRRSFWKDENIVYNCFVTFHTRKTNSIYGALEEETPMIANKKVYLLEEFHLGVSLQHYLQLRQHSLEQILEHVGRTCRNVECPAQDVKLFAVRHFKID